MSTLAKMKGAKEHKGSFRKGPITFTPVEAGFRSFEGVAGQLELTPTLKRRFRCVARFAAHDDPRQQLNGVRVTPHGVAACDGSRFIQGVCLTGLPSSVTLPLSFVRLLLRLDVWFGACLVFTDDYRSCFIRVSDGVLVVPPIPGPYPDLSRLYPVGLAIGTFEVNGAARTALVQAEAEEENFRSDGAVALSESITFPSGACVEYRPEGEVDLEVSLRYLLDAPATHFTVTAATCAITFAAGGYSGGIMPRRKQEKNTCHTTR